MINNGYILTAAEMLAAENRLIDQGTTIDALMKRAGQGAAQQIWRISRDMPTLVLCGPGNNGGDGYVIAEWLRKKGVPISVASAGEPKTDAAKKACSLWRGDTFSIEDAASHNQIIDCLFGTGLQRPITGKLLAKYLKLCENAKKCIAIDVPSGADSDTGHLLNDIPDFDMTIALGATKPSHYIEPARSKSGSVLPVNIGIDAVSDARVLSKPLISRPKSMDHKYTRGLVAIVAGEMHGAAKLTALAAQSSGAGYVKIFASSDFEAPHASIVICSYGDPHKLSELLGDHRIGAIAIGPGLGRTDGARSVLDQALDSEADLVLDADALTVLDESFVEKVKTRKQAIIATPHAGEFSAINGIPSVNKIDDTAALAKAANITMLHKGSDTVISDTNGNVALSNSSNSWLSAAGTGDVLAGIIAARLANGINPFEAVKQGHWLHNRAAQLAGPSFSPESLISFLPQAMIECL
ncbi:MAG: NAD(P)H-hydrate dehydratase [Parasphingorhabdus sp.]